MVQCILLESYVSNCYILFIFIILCNFKQGSCMLDENTDMCMSRHLESSKKQLNRFSHESKANYFNSSTTLRIKVFGQKKNILGYLIFLSL